MPITAPRDTTMLEKLTSGHFSPYLNQKFLLHSDTGEPIETELVEVSELTARALSIVFLGPQEPVVAQGTYEVSHLEMGPLSLFLVPIGPNDNGMRYEAVFA